MDPHLGIFIIPLLILANGFFVAAEFAIVTARPTRIEQLAAKGSAAARLVQRAQADPNRFISAAQLGITVASLLLGWIGEETFASLFYPPLSLVAPEQTAWIGAHGVASLLALILITFLHIALGEQVPKMVALQRAEQVSLLTAPPTEIVGHVFRPFIAVLYRFTALTLRLLGLDSHADEHASHSPEELVLLVARSASAGLLSPGRRQLVQRALMFDDLSAEELMVPRTEAIAISVDTPLDRVTQIARRHRHSRYPVYEGSIDNVIGVLTAKDLVGLRAGAVSRADPDGIRRLLRSPVLVSHATSAEDIAASMRAARQPLAVVLDEFGGTAGIVTLNNLTARLLGEIGDGHRPPAHELRTLDESSLLADGLLLVDDINSALGTQFDTDEVDTLGGLVFAHLGRRPRVGDQVSLGSGYDARVESLDGLRIARVRLVRQSG
jgi:putative hemolysin